MLIFLLFQANIYAEQVGTCGDRFDGCTFITSELPSLINGEPEFGPRDHASTIIENNKIYLLGGFYRGGSDYQDFWISLDNGYSWKIIYGQKNPINNHLVSPNYILDKSLPDPYSKIVFFSKKFYLIDNKIRYSSDGINWKILYNVGHSSSLANLATVVFNGKIFIIDSYNNLSWSLSSHNKKSKIQRIHPDFSGRSGASVYSNGDYLYIVGGYDFKKNQKFDDIWQSKNGNDWVRLSGSRFINEISMPWINLIWPCLVNDNYGLTWLFGGYDPNLDYNSNSIWFSYNGINWIKYTGPGYDEAADMQILYPRHAPMCVFDTLKSRIIAIGGKGGSIKENSSAFVTNKIISIPIDKRIYN